MKTSDVRVDVKLNKAIWSKGIRNVSRRARIPGHRPAFFHQPRPRVYTLRNTEVLTVIPTSRSHRHRFPATPRADLPQAQRRRGCHGTYTFESPGSSRERRKRRRPRDGETQKSFHRWGPNRHHPASAPLVHTQSLTFDSSLIPTGGPLLLRDRRRRPHQRGHQGCRRRLSGVGRQMVSGD